MGNITSETFTDAAGDIHFKLKNEYGQVSIVFEYETFADDFRKLIPLMSMINVELPNPSLPSFKTPPGYKVLKARQIEKHLSVLLAKDSKEYVTWLYNHEDNGCFSGHYYRKDSFEYESEALWEAQNDYERRI